MNIALDLDFTTRTFSILFRDLFHKKRETLVYVTIIVNSGTTNANEKYIVKTSWLRIVGGTAMHPSWEEKTTWNPWRGLAVQFLYPWLPSIRLPNF